jgi:uncharacterized membrane protein
MIRLTAVYALAGVFFVAFAVLSAFDRTNRRRFGNAAFWALLALSFLAGDRLGDLGNGLLVLGLVTLAGAGALGRGNPPTTSPDERRAEAQRRGNGLFLAALIIPATALAGTLLFRHVTIDGAPLVDPKQVTLVSLGLGVLIALVVSMRWMRAPVLAPLQEGRRLIDAVGWAAVLPQMIAALGAVFALAGVGDVIGGYAGAWIPEGNRLAAVAAYVIGMAVFTMVMGNAFGAFPVITAAIGLPILIRQYGGDPVIVAAIVCCPFCGTLMTPMAANFNIVPTRCSSSAITTAHPRADRHRDPLALREPHSHLRAGISLMHALTAETASCFARITLGHVTREFPNKLDHVLNDASDAVLPRALHRILYGSFDWHSCVHGYWLLMRVLRRFPNIPEADAIRALAAGSFTPAKVAGELAYLDRPSSGGFERPYGWAWLLALHAELDRHTDYEPASALEPLALAFAKRFRAWLPRLSYPIRSGTHFNSAFALLLARGWAADHDAPLRTLIDRRTVEWFAQDRDCQCWEPGGEDFLSPALIGPRDAGSVASPENGAGSPFLPASRRGAGDAVPAGGARERSQRRQDRASDGLNLSRAWCWRLPLPARCQLRGVRRGVTRSGRIRRRDGAHRRDMWVSTGSRPSHCLRRMVSTILNVLTRGAGTSRGHSIVNELRAASGVGTLKRCEIRRHELAAEKFDGCSATVTSSTTRAASAVDRLDEVACAS